MATSRPDTIEWRCSGFTLYINIDKNGLPRIEDFVPNGSQRVPVTSEYFASPSVDLDAVRSFGQGSNMAKTCKSLVGTYVSDRLEYQSHRQDQNGQKQTLEINTLDKITGLAVTHHFVAFGSIPLLRSYATVTNTSKEPVTVTQITSLAIGGITKPSKEWWEDYSISFARNGWFREAMWQKMTLSDAGLDEYHVYELRQGHDASQANFSLSNRGSFSTAKYLPMGLLEHKDGNDTWLWQVESSGSWRWEIGDFRDSVYLAAGGPTSYDHGWEMTLKPDESFTTVPVACTHVRGSAEVAFAALTDYRRQITRPHDDLVRMPIIFNDYMNCLMGDPTEEKIHALLGPVAKSGAEYFVIDAGWYADDTDWWEDVGEWEPSKKRFPSGFKTLLDKIRDQGLIPGAWLEPEVIGVKSPVASQLPEAAFFQQGGKRLVERGRFQLDYRHPAVRERMHKVVDRLVGEYGVGYFKFDYNIEVLSGTDTGGENSGVGQLGHQRAYLEWVEQILEKYPSLVLENCSSGGQRMDYAMLSVHALQSTSDQQAPEAYAPIAAAVPTGVIPEQSASWAYPQQEWSDEINALTVVNSLLGRVHLSGRLDLLDAHQFGLIKSGMDVYKSIRHLLRDAHPFWPLGFPKWHSDWVALGMRCAGGQVLVAVWRRTGGQSCVLPIAESRPDVQVELLYPLFPGTEIIAKAGSVEVSVPETVCARLFRLQL